MNERIGCDLTAEGMTAWINDYFAACNSGDVDRIAACFEPDGVHYFPPGMYAGPFRGARTIGERWHAAVASGGSYWTVDQVITDPATRRAVIEWTHFKRKAGVMLRGDEWYKFSERGLISEIRAYYASPQDSSLKVLEIGGYDYAGIHSIAISPRDPRRITVAVSTGGAWQTRDGGATWAIRAQGMYAEYMPPAQKFEQNAQDVHRLVLCAAHPEVMWAQHHNGVFRSADDAASWQEITAIKPAKFGFAVAAHPKEPGTAWFVPAVKDECRVPVDAKLVVARTRDGGKSFKVLRKGLPQQHAYDLVYRHGLDVDASGDVLAFGSTTGGLWLSEDQGDSWRCLSTRLPPIHCVRFG